MVPDQELNSLMGALTAANGVPNGNSPYTPESTAGAMRQYRAIPFDMPDVEANAKANGRIMFDGERYAHQAMHSCRTT